MTTDPHAAGLALDFAPWCLSGTVYGALLNHRAALVALGDAVNAAPYKAAPRAPVLQVKPRNTLVTGGGPVPVPQGVAELEIGATLGLVIGRTACAVTEQAALHYVAGFLLANDACIPHAEHFRPAVRLRARDGFCPLGAAVPRARVENPDQLRIRVTVDGRVVAEGSTADLLRSTARLLADVTDFMTLSAGDVLLLGGLVPAPRARAGQHVRIEADGLPPLNCPHVAEAA